MDIWMVIMSGLYKNNHYVPQWYQKRFLPVGQTNQELYYLDLKPESFTDPRGTVHQKSGIHKWGFKQCFAEEDLYTTTFGSEESTKIEQLFFGDIDSKGRGAVEHFSNFTHPSANYEAFQSMINYMSTQKLRTPKGLGFLSWKAQTADKNEILRHMLRLRNLYCAIWTECVWQIADASQSNTKFIISDHPITVYNRECGPRSPQWCRGYNDPDIWLHGTHTIFPLSLDKVLILTNLSWVRNPYQSAKKLRPNPNPFRGAMFKFMDIQVMRYLTEQEVKEINFIIKSRALRYIGAAKEEWLYPEKDISKSQWNVYGNGYLLIPDPRSMQYGGEIMIGYKDGSVDSFDEYGRKPWQPGYSKAGNTPNEFVTFHRFQGEFARLFGRKRRGRSFQFAHLDPEEDSDQAHQYHLQQEKRREK